MEKKYKFLALLLVVVALGLVLLPKNHEPKEMDPQLLLQSVAGKARYLTADQVTHRIIENDPTLLLIDLRSAEQFKVFALPGAIHIPLDSLLSQSSMELFNQPGKDKVFYSGADLIAEKAWLLGTRYSMKRIYVLQGGLQEWYETIIKPANVSPTASNADLDLISFRNAARQYFTGSGVAAKVTPTVSSEKVQVTRKAPAARSGGGC